MSGSKAIMGLSSSGWLAIPAAVFCSCCWAGSKAKEVVLLSILSEFIVFSILLISVKIMIFI